MGIPAEITAEEVELFLEYFQYNHHTGDLYWKKDKRRVRAG